MRKQTALCVVLLIALPAVADVITLKNGDRLTGAISTSDGKQLVIKTEFAGDVTVKYEAIQKITTTGDLHVELSGGKAVAGAVTTKGDNLEIATKTAGTVEAPKTSVTTMRSPAEQTAYEKSLHPGWSEGWKGGFDLGFAFTRGNSASKSLNTAFKAARQGFRDKLSLYENSVYATNDLPTASPHLTANSIGGGARYDHDFARRLFGFVNADFYHSALQNLDLRSLFGGGLGVHAIKGEATTLDLLLGGNYTHEHYSSFVLGPPPGTLVPEITNNIGGLTVGDDFMHKLGKTTVLTQSLYFYPNLSNTGQYHGKFDIGLIIKINKWLGWQNAFDDVYVSNPPMGTKKNDLLLSTGLNFSFAH